MAETCTRAFGRYLKTLRERKGLSLHDVTALSQTFPEKINKGYLSRCENGHQRLAFSKVIPLSRIYEVHSDVLLERMELDMELDRIGGPDTEGLTFEELLSRGKESGDQGFKWEAYACARDSVPVAPFGAIDARYENRDEQVVCSQMNCASAAAGLRFLGFALHEFKYLTQLGKTGPRYSAILLERISTCYRRLGDFDEAAKYADAAIDTCAPLGDDKYLGYLLSSRALVESDRGNFEPAAEFFQSSYRAFRSADFFKECATTLNNLAQCYFDVGNYRAAKRSLAASQRISTREELSQTHALSQILLGEIDEREKRVSSAARRWKDAARTAKTLNDKVLRFQAEFPRYRLAIRLGDEAVARAIGRRLRLLAPSMPEHLVELREFKAMTASSTNPTVVSLSQPRH